LTILMVGDVVGEAGLLALEEGLPGLVARQHADFVVVNGENATGGFGMTEANLQRILAAGADVVTSGNHIWEKREFMPVLESEARVLRPAYFPPVVAGQKTSGHGWGVFETTKSTKKVKLWVVNLQGRDLMTPIDDPFCCFDVIYEKITHEPDGQPLVLVDFHAEATREKEALALYLDGRATVLVGTHTHVQTSDERILPKGTAYITDLGFTGDRDSILGMDTDTALRRAKEQVLYKMTAAGTSGGAAGVDRSIQGVCVTVDDATGRATAISRL
jgi:metallophosphoesterase (TIGR00282 family)